MVVKKKKVEKEIVEAVDESFSDDERVGKTKEDSKITKLDDLPGIGPVTIEKLREAHFEDLMSIAVASAGVLSDVAGITEATANKAIAAARDAMELGFISAEEVSNKRKSITKITIGSTEVDKLIGGGIESQGITECFGEFGSGKSQIAMQLAVNVQLPVDQGGLDGYCVFIDTENTFRPERIKQIAEARGLDPEKVMKKIMVARAFTSDHQMLLAEKISDLIKDKKLPVKLIIMDSMMGLFRSEYAGRGTLATRQQKLNKHIHTLQKLADLHNIAIYITNQVMSRPDIFFGNPTAAIGGHILHHACQFRIYLRKGKAGKRIARLIDSPYLPEGEAIFKVTEKGIEDA
ncbi:DNA repair and recombination protein RadA [Candidatus Woesearchaeota archaeon]|jgi:DNA repair protein RadA|nr:DNA repair and recombination protein RadA [Candidatus Woesearchaeota archaeon]MBT4114601.1 DNA repair and recombination protein RadA [Candidatus Woesearchaeota archaeon]MBT4248482.1 DNA repair and recombination protein RadA [Candidatus Woesearchaeota archaeon]